MLGWSSLFALGLAFLYIILLQCFPKFMNNGAVTLSGLVLIAAGIAMLIRLQTDHTAARWVTVIALFLLGLYLLPAFFFKKSQLRINGIFLQQSTVMLRQHLAQTLYIPLFVVMTIGLFALTLFELFSFWSIPNPSFDPNKVFNTVSGKGYVFLSVLVSVQLFWGFFFLREFCKLLCYVSQLCSWR